MQDTRAVPFAQAARVPAHLLLTPSKPGAWGCALCHLLSPSTCRGKGRAWRAWGVAPRESELCRPVASEVRASALLFVPSQAIHCVSVCQPHAGSRLQASAVTSQRQRGDKTEEVSSPPPEICWASSEWVEEAGQQRKAVVGRSSDARPARWEVGVRVVSAPRRPCGQSPVQGSGPPFPGAPEGVVDDAVEAPSPLLEGRQELPVPSPSKTGHGTQITALGQDTSFCS